MSPTPPWRGARRGQMYPLLTAEEIARLRHFGTLRDFAAGDVLIETGRSGLGMIVVLEGNTRVLQHDGLGHEVTIGDRGPGQFLAEVGQLSGKAALVDVRALTD